MKTILQKLKQLSFIQKRNCFFISYLALLILDHINLGSINTLEMVFFQLIFNILQLFVIFSCHVVMTHDQSKCK